jgi:hypothetical protein
MLFLPLPRGKDNQHIENDDDKDEGNQAHDQISSSGLSWLRLVEKSKNS